jgi:hypothetical protein
MSPVLYTSRDGMVLERIDASIEDEGINRR